jgi:hypothetical protein
MEPLLSPEPEETSSTIEFRDGVGGFITVHPSFILRLRDEDKDEEYLLGELRQLRLGYRR